MSHLEKSEVSISKKSPIRKLFNKPPKWSLGLLKFLIVILISLLSNAPDIQLNFYIINIMI